MRGGGQPGRDGVPTPNARPLKSAPLTPHTHSLPRQAIDWRALEERRVPSSFRPAVAHSLSVENFDKMWTEQRPEDSPCGTPTDPAFGTAFEGFTYVSPSFLTASMVAAAAAAAARGSGGGAASGGGGAAPAAAAAQGAAAAPAAADA